MLSFFYKPEANIFHPIVKLAAEKLKEKNPVSDYAIPLSLGTLLNHIIEDFFKKNPTYPQTHDKYPSIAEIIAKYLNNLPTKSPGVMSKWVKYFELENVSYPSNVDPKKLLLKLEEMLIGKENTHNCVHPFNRSSFSRS